MTLFFKRDWTPVSFQDASQEVRGKNYEFDHISFGHDVETAYLMLEASKELGIENDSATIRVAKELDDFTLQNGWDIKNGGIYDRGYIFKGDQKVTIIRNAKEWWCQIEALNSFLLMSKLFPGAKENYYEKFCLEWEHIKRYLIDPVYGGWFWDSIDTSPDAKLSNKGSIWKATYHTARGLINSIKQLNNDK
jgi:mannobiose 2-epimerase